MSKRRMVKERRGFLRSIFVLFLAGFFASISQATVIYPFEIFTNNGHYSDGESLNFYVDVTEVGAEQVDFTFYNGSEVKSTIAKIFLDTDSLSGIAEITSIFELSFSDLEKKSNLPGGHTLDPSFEATLGLSAGADPSPAHNGINQNEWVKIIFNLTDGKTFGDVIDELNSGVMRIGEHIIALPDGSSESAVNIPEPMTIMLAGIGMGLIGRRIKHKLPARKR